MATTPPELKDFVAQLGRIADASKLDKSLTMLRGERFQLFSDMSADQVVGVVKSQREPDLVYSCRLGADGSFSCCTNNLNVCGGLRGSPCKHILVLVVGLVQGGTMTDKDALAWLDSSRAHKAALAKDQASSVLLRYKGAEAGEVDWRPTETVPEDFYAF